MIILINIKDGINTFIFGKKKALSLKIKTLTALYTLPPYILNLPRKIS